MSSGKLRPRDIACGAVAAVGILAGIGQAVLWSAIAPQERWVAYPNHGPLALPTESTHRFTAIGMFALISLVIGVVLAVAAWQIRFARGAQMLLSAGLGAAAGSSLALWLGPVFAGGRLPVNVHPVGAAELVTMPPSISWTLVVVAPLAVLVIYTFLASWHPDAKLGRPQVTRGSDGLVAGGATDQSVNWDELATLTTAPIPLPVLPLDPPTSGPQALDPQMSGSATGDSAVSSPENPDAPESDASGFDATGAPGVRTPGS